MIGGFGDGTGEFYNQELFNGRAIFVRIIFSDITPKSFRLEQAFLRRRRQVVGGELDREVRTMSRP